jgi:hypothetical protein
MWNNIKNKMLPAFEEWRPTILEISSLIESLSKSVIGFIKNNKELIMTIAKIGFTLTALGSALGIIVAIKVAVFALGLVMSPVLVTVGAIATALTVGWTIGKFILELEYMKGLVDELANNSVINFLGTVGVDTGEDEQKRRDSTKEAILSKKNSMARMKANELNQSQTRADNSGHSTVDLNFNDPNGIVKEISNKSNKKSAPVGINYRGQQ